MSVLLVSAAELAARLGDPRWRVFDCRHDLKDTQRGEQAYAAGHIPGALFLHLDRDLSGATTGRNGRHPLPEVAAFAARMSACGVGPQTQVVAYDNGNGIFAARLWWMLRWLGHDNVAVLDGGVTGWQRAGHALAIEVPSYAPADFVARPCGGLVDANYVLARLNQPQMLMIDARAADRFAGMNETLDPVGGHIPGAVNRCFVRNLDDKGLHFKSAQQLRAEFTELLAGRAPDSVIQQCGSGVTACHNLLAMELAGLSGSQLYAGSWSEWCADLARPVATGS